MLKKIYLSVAITLCFVLSVTNVHAQGAFENWAIGVEAGTYGPGITLATSLSPNFKLRAGFDYFGYTAQMDFDLEADGVLENNSSVDNISLTGSLSDPKINFSNFKAIVDYYPRKNGIFSISAGLYAGSSAITASAKIDNYQRLVDANGGPIIFEFEDIVIKPKSDGSFDGKIKFGNFIKPYFGLGLGRTIANSRLGFKFDLGLIYQGDYTFESDQLSSQKLTSKASSLMEDSDIPSSVLNFWPVINFSLSYRFK
ncbi:hypothetical protein FACS189432_07160 [Bacteroidia bacterium]|nr:hypothetical protein FACS189426_09000 [Bacteroidia bacterium]GHT28761.1 hypothetical protein FACS189432_07160 [Bacteroidia bacterium]